MKKFLKKIFILGIIIAILVVPLNFVMKSSRNYLYHSMNEMYECDRNIDLVFLGSSHVFRGFVPSIADKMLGCKTFNAGSSAQGMNMSYYLLREVNMYHKLKIVFLDTFYGVANMPGNDGQVFTISDFMKFGYNKFAMLYSNGGIETILNGVLTFRRGDFDFVNNIKSHFIDINDYTLVTNETAAYRGYGFVYSFGVADANDETIYANYVKPPKYADLRAKPPFSKLYHDSLIQIIKYCKENNIKLVLMSLPVPRKTTDYAKDYNNYIQHIKAIANKYGVEYWNFDLYKYDTGLTMADYKDGGHLNGKGATKFTTFLCNFINDVKSGKISAKDSFRETY